MLWHCSSPCDINCCVGLHSIAFALQMQACSELVSVQRQGIAEVGYTRKVRE